MAPRGATRHRAVSLFSGVGGLDLGLSTAGVDVVEMCESWEPARRVLRARFPGIPIADDVRHFQPRRRRATILAAGFPCTNISHLGDRSGIGGPASGLVEHVFRIAQEGQFDWILLENVPNLLALHRGEGMRFITSELGRLGYRWAYRTVDSRFTGVPQRRPRVVIAASRSVSPAWALLSPEATPREANVASGYGFYWTEGRHSVGLVPDAIPTLKGGSTLGLPSAPAVWVPSRPAGHKIVLPTTEQGEALQGLRPGWTSPALADAERDMRWKLIGNAVTVGVGAWLGGRVLAASSFDDESDLPCDGPLDVHQRWPDAGWGGPDGAWASPASRWPERRRYRHLADIVDEATAQPLSHRATAGFLSRLAESGLPVMEELYRDLEEHLAATRPVLSRSGRSRRPSSAAADSWASSAATRRRMQATGGRDTKPEVALRRALWALGLRYRVQVRPEIDLRWRMDVVLRQSKIAVDVRGCFWHACALHGTRPKVNRDRWADKLRANVERDERIVDALSQRGWCVVVVWEHDDPRRAAQLIAQLAEKRRDAVRHDGSIQLVA